MAGDLDRAAGASGCAAGRAGVIQAVPGFLRGPGVHLLIRGSCRSWGSFAGPGLLQVLGYPEGSPAGLIDF